MNDQTKQQKILFVDASLLNQSDCWRKIYYQHFVIMLSGTIDFNGTYAGERCLVDHKTTAARDEMFFYRFNFDIQPMFYVWVDNYLNMRGDVYLPFLVNGIFLKKPSVKAMNEDRWDGCEFRRSSLIHYSINQMHEFSSWLENK